MMKRLGDRLLSTGNQMTEEKLPVKESQVVRCRIRI
jgi:hypothetical protein